MNVLVIESNETAGHGSIDAALREDADCVVTSSTAIPDDLLSYHVLVLNNVYLSNPLVNASAVRLEEYVKGGGGCLAIHDSIFPREGFESFLALLGLQLAFEGISLTTEPDGSQRMGILLAQGDPNVPGRSFVVRPTTVEPIHPIVREINALDLADEFWAYNTAADVTPLLYAEVGDRLPVPPRLHSPTILAGCRTVQNGRCLFFSLGHFSETYFVDSIQTFLRNSVLWAGRRINMSPWTYDLFISFSSENKDKAVQVAESARSFGLQCFLSETQLEFGDIWDEEIRLAILGSREMCVLITEAALRSEWITTEWGVAWALEKRITPVLIDLAPRDLPDRLRRHQAANIEEIEEYLSQVEERASENNT